MEQANTYLKTVPFTDFLLWDVKRYITNALNSDYPLVLLSKLIYERSERVKLYDFPDKEFKILGVNNKTGLFDAYTELGANINQSYKKVYNQDLAYNPYRINVGSIGWKTPNQKNEFISPAYVVFGTNDELSSEYLYLIFKTDTFNKIINDNTTGSVRQNLKFDTLVNIKIPLPPLSEQNRIVAQYNQKIQLAQQQEQEANNLEQEIEEYLYSTLGISKTKKVQKEGLLDTINYREVDRWAVDSLGRLAKIENKFKGLYPLIKFRELIFSTQYGLSEKSSKEIVGPPMLRMNNIYNGELNLDDLKYISINDSTYKKYKLNKGDLLFNRTNSKELVGKTALFDSDDEYTFASYLIRVVLKEDLVNKKFINYLFNSSILQFQKDLISRQITGQANINAQEMQELLFPLPDCDKQNEIANHIDGLKNQIKSLRRKANANREKALLNFEQEIFTS
ncbi:Type I restriction enzyme EcoKI specificity protein [Tenacibaculum litoreum]|uniref:restriction endonuclease subunit S n=1 Tax=Tenacibaculum litoreum TaxID=321269 RepID=UPI0038930400